MPWASPSQASGEQQSGAALAVRIAKAVLYRYDLHETRNDMVVPRERCELIQGHFVRHHKENQEVERVEYFNVRLGIGNPVVWVLPDICRKAGEKAIRM